MMMTLFDVVAIMTGWCVLMCVGAYIEERYYRGKE